MLRTQPHRQALLLFHGLDVTSRLSAALPIMMLCAMQALVVYAQWAMLIINLPVSWLPWATGSTADAPTGNAQSITSSFEKFVGFLFGRSASIDCFLQAWNLLQKHEVQAIVSNTFTRAVGR
jgi:hypothetical protein